MTPTSQKEPQSSAGSRIGIDLGGTKIEAILLDHAGREAARKRIATPRGDYSATLEAIAAVVAQVETAAEVADRAPVGIGIPGGISRRTGKVHNANSVWLNGRNLNVDLAEMLGRPVRIANDANCFALSEAADGAGAGCSTVHGVILGTGAGSGIVVAGKILDGPLGIGGEWGHNSLPWASGDEIPGPKCWCGRHGCLEAWVSGPALAADHLRVTGSKRSVEEIVAAAATQDKAALATLDRHASRLARGLAHVVNIIDPDVIVLGGGLSKLSHLYAELPGRMRPHIFADDPVVSVLPPRWGDAGGVRGAAWLAGT
jgi:fructokinase